MAIVGFFVVVLRCCFTEANMITKRGTIIIPRVTVGVKESL